MKKIQVSDEIIQEAKNIIDGFYEPLEGFLYKEQLESVLNIMRLPSGDVWSMPIVCDVDEGELCNFSENCIVLTNGRDEALLSGIEVYEYDKKNFCQKLFGTIDEGHPGVKKFLNTKKYFIGGKIEELKMESNHMIDVYRTASEVREIFKKNKWRTIAAFQTRNPPHRSHEHLQKKALSQTDGLLINPVIGPKKSGDFRDEYIIGAYNELIKHHFPENSVVFTTFHTFMRYAGPREAVFHALVRRNMGCTHMIIGRDHAGVGDYYDSFAAHDVFNEFNKEELGVNVLKYKNVYFCPKCGAMREEGECNHVDDYMHLSGTKLRSKLMKNESISEEFIRKGVMQYLSNCKGGLFI